jgi:hypothetical protein
VRRFLLLLALGSVLCALAAANPLCVNGDNLQNYINNYASQANACQIGDKLFWGFNIVNNPQATASGPAASSINVQALPFDGLTNVGINFNGGWVISSSGVLDQTISFNVITLSGQALIKDLTLIIAASLSDSTGSVNVTESVVPSVAGTPLTANVGTQLVHNDFSPNYQTSFAVSDHLAVTGGSSFLSFAHLSAIENDFSELVTVPEPTIASLIGSGLLLFGLVQRRCYRRG